MVERVAAAAGVLLCILSALLLITKVLSSCPKRTTRRMRLQRQSFHMTGSSRYRLLDA